MTLVKRRPPGRPLFCWKNDAREHHVKTKTPFEEKLLAIATPVAADLGLEIVRLRVQGGERRKRLQIMAERADGTMIVEDCAALSRAVSAVFDVEDPFVGIWDLEVSSPGVDRPLTTLEHFTRWRGYEAKLELDRLVENRKRFAGVLAGVEDDNVLIDLPGEDGTAVIPFSWLAEAKLVLTDALIEESLKRRPAAPADPGDEQAEET